MQKFTEISLILLSYIEYIFFKRALRKFYIHLMYFKLCVSPLYIDGRILIFIDIKLFIRPLLMNKNKKAHMVESKTLYIYIRVCVCVLIYIYIYIYIYTCMYVLILPPKKQKNNVLLVEAFTVNLTYWKLAFVEH